MVGKGFICHLILVGTLSCIPLTGYCLVSPALVYTESQKNTGAAEIRLNQSPAQSPAQMFPQPLVASNNSVLSSASQTAEPKPTRSEDKIKPKKKIWNFQTNSLGSLAPEWIPISGRWSVTQEPENPNNHVLWQSQVKRLVQLLLSKKKYTNFDYSARFRAITLEPKTRNWQMGLIFHRVDKLHYYKLRITAANIGLLRFSSFVSDIIPGSRTTTKAAAATGRGGKEGEQVLMILPLGAKADTWYTLGISCWGDRICIKFNGREVRTLYDLGVGSGQIGVFTYKTSAYCDDLKLIYYPNPPGRDGLYLPQNHYSLKSMGDFVVYYQNPRAGPLQLNILDPQGRIFYQLAQGNFSSGIHSIIWDGYGTLGQKAEPGVYHFELILDKKHYRKKINIEP